MPAEYLGVIIGDDDLEMVPDGHVRLEYIYEVSEVSEMKWMKWSIMNRIFIINVNLNLNVNIYLWGLEMSLCIANSVSYTAYSGREYGLDRSTLLVSPT